MQNKGLIRILAACLFLACAFYLSFSFITKHYDKKAKVYAQEHAMVDGVVNDSIAKIKEAYFLDSIATDKIWFGYTLKQCREKEINLGLDLKGGMNITMEVSVPDILDALSGHSTSENYKAAIALAKEKQKDSGDDFLKLFFQSFHEVAPDAKLASIFASLEMQSKIKSNTDDTEVEKVIQEEVEGAIDNSFNVLRNRIDRFGVVQPNIQKLSQSGRFLIELPGIKDPKRVEKLLQGSANLEFWETYELSEILPALAQINRDLVAASPKAETEEVEEPQAEATQTDSVTKAQVNQAAREAEYKRNFPLFAMLNTPLTETMQPATAGPVVGAKVHYTDTARVSEILNSRFAKSVLPREIRFAWSVKSVDDRGSYYQLIALKSTRAGRPSLEGDVVTDARADFSQTSAYADVSMAMNSEGAKKWQQLTRENIGKCVAIVLDGYVYSFPRVNDEIAGGRSQITGNFTVEEAKDLANTLKSGKMPAPAHIIEENVVGPSLGREAIRAGLLSFALGFLLILIYMIFYYGWIPGLIADAALCCNVFLLVGILASFSAVLTLPGIAGIVLTMGMAVDANVLIYERIREELRSGKGMRKAIEDGFKGAISAIVDANVTSFLTGAILAIFGTGPIKGFAVTYMIGIISSFLTAVFITRLLLEDYCRRDNAKELSFTTRLMKNFLQNIHFDFVNARKWAYCISGGVLIFAILGLEPHLFGKLNLGIDFSGGRNYVVRFDQNINTQEVRESLDNVFSATLEDGELFSLNVITFGNDANQVRISTNYRINDASEEMNDKIDSLLFEGCKPFLSEAFMSVEDPFAEFCKSESQAEVGVMQSQKVGPAIADDIKTSAVWAVLAALIVIFLYILLRFRNFAYSVGALVALAHDTIIILGLYAILWKIMPFSMEIDQAFIAAILTVIGYSINDTVVIFDRVREYNTLYPKREKKININDALNNTLSRTFSTSMSTFVVLLAIFVFGGETIRGFVFALLMGVIVGTYSSLFIASPIAYDIQRAQERRAEKKAALKK